MFYSISPYFQLSSHNFIFTYLAICSSSLSLGVPLCTNIPRFILAGSRAQLDIPMKAHFIHGSGFLLPSQPSSRSGCKLYRGIQHLPANQSLSKLERIQCQMPGFHHTFKIEKQLRFAVFYFFWEFLQEFLVK